MIRLRVDQDKCIGSGICEMLEEATFLIDEDTNLSGVQGPGLLPADRAAKVIDECPASAIFAVECDGAGDDEPASKSAG